MVRTFLQVAAGAADIPVTRLLGQSPAGLSATGDSDTRNYYDMIAARQEIDLRPQLERLDRLLMRSAGVAPAALTFAFRPLWQLSAAEAASVALVKAQATQVYAGLKLWPDATMARLIEAQLAEDGTYPGAGAVFAESAGAAGQGEAAAGTPAAAGSAPTLDFDPGQPRDPDGRWTAGGGAAGASLLRVNGNERKREFEKELEETGGPPPPVQEMTPDLLDPAPRLTPRGVPGSGGAALPPKLNPPLSRNMPLLASPTTAPTAGASLPGIIGPGPFARESLLAGPSRDPSTLQREEINRMGHEWGCHWCGSTDPGSDSGNFIPDHQPPSSLLREGEPQYLLPHCLGCSRRQGGLVRWLKDRGYQP